MIRFQAVSRLAASVPLLLAVTTAPARAAEGLDGAALGPLWALPFAGMLLSIALMPLLAGHFWEHHLGKIAAGWSLLLLLPLAATQGLGISTGALLHMLLLEYLPFILVILALFTISGGILITGNIHGSPRSNTLLLAIGTLLASLIGTTGAAMVMIRPLLRANDNRRHNAHVVVFFIFLVANIGGSLTPLGDPPLFLGFLRGVSFFWTAQHLWAPMLFASTVLLALFYLIDLYWYRREGVVRPDPTPDSRVGLRGRTNIVLIFVLIGAILASAVLELGVIHVAGVPLEIENLLRDGVMIGVTLLSLWLTPGRRREANGFTWAPVAEVAKLFVAIFICIMPVMAMLQAGPDGAFAGLVRLVSDAQGGPNNVAYFWLTGLLSSFLDNAPTYLVFFQMAGAAAPDGHVAAHLMGAGAATLAAISLGAVFMGANTYIGNAPNFMVYAIAARSGVRMPGFFGYMLWSGAILLPLFLVLSLIFLH